MKTELEIAKKRILELENEVKKLTSNTVLAGCSHLWTKSLTSASTDWRCNRCGGTTNIIGINANLR